MMTSPKTKNGKSEYPGSATFHRHRQEFQDYLPVIQRVQDDLKADIAELQDQEGWNECIAEGIREWSEDTNTIWRVLRRHRYDTDKAHDALLTIVAKRVSMGLQDPLPNFAPHSDSPLFYVLPLPKNTDRLGRPIVVLTLKHVLRDENGKMDDMKQWSWWALEMVRRTLKEWWATDTWRERDQKMPRGQGGEGCVMLVDAAGSSYRNLEVELLPTLMSVGHNNYPGVFDAVYIVNAGWTHRSMWGVVKRVLPKSALDKVAFLNQEKDIVKIFDLDRLPKELGGRDPMNFETSGNPILKRYSRQPSYGVISRQLSRSISSSSIADVYHTARNTPSSSRRQSLAGGAGLAMTKGEPVRSRSDVDLRCQPTDMEVMTEEPVATTRPEEATTPVLSRQPSRSSTTSEGPLQRIKSLSNFHLYLSPSRLANVDLLFDSDDEDTVPPPPPPPKKQLMPVMFEAPAESIAERRRRRPPLSLLGNVDPENARSYSDRLQQHHAKFLEAYKDSSKTILPPDLISPPLPQPVDTDAEPVQLSSPSPPGLSSATLPEANQSPSNISDPKQVSGESLVSQTTQPISAFSSDVNPWYGYPAIRSGSTLRPRYQRNRKRDLVKTLLFLFILRVQSWRDAFERWLGLNKLGTWGLRRAGYDEPKDPSTGLVQAQSSERKGELVKAAAEKDWIWMVITFLLLRGTWTRILAGPLEAVGLSSVRDVLGLV